MSCSVGALHAAHRGSWRSRPRSMCLKLFHVPTHRTLCRSEAVWKGRLQCTQRTSFSSSQLLCVRKFVCIARRSTRSSVAPSAFIIRQLGTSVFGARAAEKIIVELPLDHDDDCWATPSHACSSPPLRPTLPHTPPLLTPSNTSHPRTHPLALYLQRRQHQPLR